MVIHSRVPQPDWTDKEGGGEAGARCRNFEISRDPDGVVRNDTWYQSAEDALPVCNGDWIGTPCPVRRSCLAVSLVNNDKGVWGGMTEPQRKWIRRNVKRERWYDDAHLREVTPDPDYFKDYGDEDPDQDEEDFRAEQDRQGRAGGIRGGTEDPDTATP